MPDTDAKKDPRGGPPNKPKVTVKRPTALAEALSPLKVLDSVLKPIYMITLKDASVDHNMPITAMSLYQSQVIYIHYKKRSFDYYWFFVLL